MKKRLTAFCIIATMAAFFVLCKNNDEHDLFGKINGTVTDRVSGAAISGVNVILSPGGMTKQTGSDGFYEFENLEPGDYSVNVQHIGYKTDRQIITVRVGESALASFSLIKEDDL